MSDPAALGLPHREPFIFVDSVLELQAGHSAVARKVFPLEEPFFRGHFPGEPLVPGVILVEALAQTAGISVGQPGRSFRLSAIKTMKFPGAVLPCQEIRLEAVRTLALGGLWQFDVVASVGGRVVATGVIVLSEA